MNVQPFKAWGAVLALFGCSLFASSPRGGGAGEGRLDTSYTAEVRPLLKAYCLKCHSAKAKKGGLDLERFATAADVRKGTKAWQGVVEQVEVGEMPPRKSPQPTAPEKAKLLAWARALLRQEAIARAGDPGHVPLRRLSNSEYDHTLRDLTGVDLRPAREFPADGAAGEGFTNAAEALSDISPALLTKYINAAKEVAAHAVLLPDGFRFSPTKTRRDWSDEGTARLRAFYARVAPPDGRLPYRPYLAATVRHREALRAGQFSEVAAREKLNAKYLRALWQALTDKTPSQPLDALRAKWRAASEKDVPALAADVAAWQAALWKTVKVGNYVQASWNSPGGYTESLTRQVPNEPPATPSAPVRLAVKPTPGASEVVLHLAASEKGKGGQIVWHRPRFEAKGKPALLLRDYADFGPAFEVDFRSAFVGTGKYLAAVVELANAPKPSPRALAKARGLDAAFLENWAKVLAVPPRRKPEMGRAAVALTPLEEKSPPAPGRPAVKGWKKKGTDLPAVVANSSGKVELIPGRLPGRSVCVHPTPTEFVAVTWTSPVAGPVRVAARVAHAHPACGNGVAWWLEHRRAGKAALLGEGALDLGKEAALPARAIKLEKGDVLVLAVDARDGNHICDLTEVHLTITEDEKPKRAWSLGADVSGDVQAGNPHADRHGHAGVWGFARGPSGKPGPAAPLLPAGSALARWREAASAGREAEAAQLAKQAERLLAGPRPGKGPDAALYDRLVAPDGPLFAGVDVRKLAAPRVKTGEFGLPKKRFTGEGVVAASGEVVSVRLPAALLAGREFVVDAKLEGPGDRLARVRVATSPPGPDTRWDGPVLATPGGAAYRQLVAGHDAFRKAFPLFVCFPRVVPTDEVVTLKMFHREDEPLLRLFLDDEQARQLDRMWAEQRFVSRQPVAEYDYLPQFMEYTTQDTPKPFQQFFINRKPLFARHAKEFLDEEKAAIPKQLDALVEFAARAYRRPLAEKEKAGLRELYAALLKKGVAHDEAFRGVLSRVLTSPHFLFRVERAPPGKAPAEVNDWELAARLSYFLWSSAPDDELRKLAAVGRLRDPKVLAAQAERMLKDGRTRALAVEFGTQWIHVRGFDEFNEKNEKLFPAFDAPLRKAMYEEAILFFQDLFQNGRPVASVLDADHTFANEALARHYGIPGVKGPHFRRVEGVRKYGRGGVLGLASVQAKQSGASRTSPVLRGNWVVETLLGEKLPRPPADVPKLPEEVKGELTTRQLVERHAKEPSCAACHVRIDPFGFALEGYDPIGRRRDRETTGLPVDAKAKLRDGSEFEGLDGLRNYLLTKKKDVIVRLFCRRLLGYALGRSVALSDTALLDEMVAELKKNDGRVTAAVLTIVRSKQFRMVRGADFKEE